MRVNFKKCLKFTLVWEGGYVNHPRDPGGPTNKGVTQRVYDAWRANNGKPKQSVKQITQEEVEAIYKKQYWDAVRGDDLPLGVDLAIFDYAVNSGVGRATRALQKVVKTKQDGQIGALTLDKVKTQPADALAVAICEERFRFVKNLSTWSTFGKGWQRRIMGEKLGAQESDKGIIDIAQRMARSEALPPLPTKEAGGKADPIDTKVSSEPETVATGSSTISVVGMSFADGIASIGQWAGMTKDQIQPFVDYSSYIKYFFVALLVISIAGGLGAFLKRKKEGQIQ